MPLKKPNEIPKIPKTRRKSISALKKAIPLKKKTEIEFEVRFFFKYDGALRKQFYVIFINTIKEFSYLNYEVAVEVARNKDVIDISLQGLNMKHSYLVEPRSAYKELLFEDLYGEYTINLIKQDGSINTAILNFNIFRKEMVLVAEKIPSKKNNSRFCTFIIEKEYFTFQKSENKK